MSRKAFTIQGALTSQGALRDTPHPHMLSATLAHLHTLTNSLRLSCTSSHTLTLLDTHLHVLHPLPEYTSTYMYIYDIYVQWHTLAHAVTFQKQKQNHTPVTPYKGKQLLACFWACQAQL